MVDLRLKSFSIASQNGGGVIRAYLKTQSDLSGHWALVQALKNIQGAIDEGRLPKKSSYFRKHLDYAGIDVPQESFLSAQENLENVIKSLSEITGASIESQLRTASRSVREI